MSRRRFIADDSDWLCASTCTAGSELVLPSRDHDHAVLLVPVSLLKIQGIENLRSSFDRVKSTPNFDVPFHVMFCCAPVQKECFVMVVSCLKF